MGSRSVLHNMIHAFFGEKKKKKKGAETDARSRIWHNYMIRPHSGCTLAVMAKTVVVVVVVAAAAAAAVTRDESDYDYYY